jgi:hypothetical protein
MSVRADSRVDEYIGRLPDWQQAICHQARRLVHAVDPEVEETIKRSVRPYFVLQGNICALLAARAIQIYHGDAINRPALLAMFRAVIANNRGRLAAHRAITAAIRVARNRSPVIPQPGDAQRRQRSAGTRSARQAASSTNGNPARNPR